MPNSSACSLSGAGGGARQVQVAAATAQPAAAAATAQQSDKVSGRSSGLPASRSAATTGTSCHCCRCCGQRHAPALTLQACVSGSRSSGSGGSAQAGIISKQSGVADDSCSQGQGRGEQAERFCIQAAAPPVGGGGSWHPGRRYRQAQDCVLPVVLPHRQVRATGQGLPIQVSRVAVGGAISWQQSRPG